MRLTYKETQKIVRSSKWKTFRSEYLKKYKPTHCDFCDKPIEGNDITLDHIQPLVEVGEEGAYEETNIQVMCRSCNGRKNDRTLVRRNYMNERLLEL